MLKTLSRSHVIIGISGTHFSCTVQFQSTKPIHVGTQASSQLRLTRLLSFHVRNHLLYMVLTLPAGTSIVQEM